MCLLCLKEIQKYWRINNNVLDLFLQYLDRSIAERLHAAANDFGGGGGGGATKRSEAAAPGAASASPMPPPRREALLSPTLEQARTQDELLEDQYFNLVNGHWEGDDALGDLGLFLQADDFAPVKGFDILGRSI